MLPPRRIIAIFASLFLATASSSWADSVTLAWNPNPEPDIAGYHVLYGTTSGQLTQVVDEGAATIAIVSTLLPGTQYFFAVTAYNTAAMESSPSSEISYTTAGAAPIPTPTPTTTPSPTPSSTLDVTITPTSTSFAKYTFPTVNIAAGTYVLTFEGQGSGDSTAMIDRVTIDDFLLPNGGFENPAQASSFVYNPTGAGWVFAGGAGIQGNGSQWGAANAPEGTQTAFVQNSNPSQKT
ncbi:MAG: fibronectin type III domain-containing protein, partial [Verrucomicrobiota bacterium]|nr:fibronectin type III domain-containing protein [Verrucomicrobiota bacterium]